MEKYDYIVIGGGSGGIASANRAGMHGQKVLLIEGNQVGGTCVNVGCVPKKVTWQAAALNEQLDYAADYGFDITKNSFDFSKLVMNRSKYIEFLHGAYMRGLESNKVTYLQGYASFVDGHTIQVENETYTAPHILIATGGRPNQLNIPGEGFAIDSDGFFELTELPASVAIIGTGYIAVEFAGMLNSLGVKVDIYAKYNHLLPHFDQMISEAITSQYEAHNITIHRQTNVTGIQRKSSGELEVKDETGALLLVDQVVMATGRHAVTDNLHLENTEVRLSEQGTVLTDKYQNTSAKGIYAIGDVTGRLDLTPVAIAAGRQLSERLFNHQPDAHLDYETVPTVVFAHPTIGTVGLTEAQAIEKYGIDDLKVYTSTFTPMFYGVTAHREKESLKLICATDQEYVVGLHGVGMSMDEILQGFAVAIKMHATKKDFDSTVAIHPTQAEEFVTMKIFRKAEKI